MGSHQERCILLGINDHIHSQQQVRKVVSEPASEHPSVSGCCYSRFLLEWRPNCWRTSSQPNIGCLRYRDFRESFGDFEDYQKVAFSPKRSQGSWWINRQWQWCSLGCCTAADSANPWSGRPHITLHIQYIATCIGISPRKAYTDSSDTEIKIWARKQLPKSHKLLSDWTPPPSPSAWPIAGQARNTDQNCWPQPFQMSPITGC